MKTLKELGPSKLLDAEQERVRHAADNLIFSVNLARDVAAREALDDVERLSHALTDSGRWEQVTADRLVNDICACGPVRPAELKAA
jgi:hypothetical protein